MSFAVVAAVGAGALAASVGVQIHNGVQQGKAQKNAMNDARDNALKQESAAQQSTNKANQKKPDTLAILSSAQQAGKAGPSGTMLTGPMGVDPNALTLGKTTLLGQ